MRSARADHVETFQCMGSRLSLVIGPPMPGTRRPPADAAAVVRHWLESYEARVSRFRPASEVQRMNADPAATIEASPLLRSVVSAGIWAAKRSGGLVDPTLLGPLERLGYAETRAGTAPASLADALASAPARHAALPAQHPGWGDFHVDAGTATIKRPPGVQFDPGGTGKGLAADVVAARLRGYSRFAVDCGGDLRIGGSASSWTPFWINVAHPLTRGTAHVLQLTGGGVATSGLSARLWRGRDGQFRHHLIDPATGEPAWTGLISATAVAPTTLEAETLAKTALLAGPAGARQVLAAHGGVTIDDNGDVELHGPLRRRRARAA